VPTPPPQNFSHTRALTRNSLIRLEILGNFLTENTPKPHRQFTECKPLFHRVLA
jgi:hypothetical protein